MYSISHGCNCTLGIQATVRTVVYERTVGVKVDDYSWVRDKIEGVMRQFCDAKSRFRSLQGL